MGDETARTNEPLEASKHRSGKTSVNDTEPNVPTSTYVQKRLKTRCMDLPIKPVCIIDVLAIIIRKQ